MVPGWTRNNQVKQPLCYNLSLSNYSHCPPSQNALINSSLSGKTRPLRLATNVFNAGLYQAGNTTSRFEVSGPESQTGHWPVTSRNTAARHLRRIRSALQLPLPSRPQTGSTIRITIDPARPIPGIQQADNVIHDPGWHQLSGLPVFIAVHCSRHPEPGPGSSNPGPHL